MRWYVALTYNAGMVQVRSNNKYEALKFLEDNDYQVYYIETLNKYFNEEIGKEESIIVETTNIIN
ncbi:MAG: hypothetical protein PUC22_04630 [Turicibacter sp.]|jgi:hypothetical protein|nr:hypothetical protein [Turicibacter sp.]MDD7546591.1 hypothetical protein [Bacilli bacterium]